MKREPAYRIFAGEYNDTTHEIKGDAEKQTPNHIITPLGANVNRVFIAGVLTDVENVNDSGDFIRAHLSDPTGVFTIYSGQYQPEITSQLQGIEVPAFVAIIGKARTYQPDEGEMYVSVRPEVIQTISSDQRDEWITQTSKMTLARIQAMRDAQQNDNITKEELTNYGNTEDQASGILEAIRTYQTIDTRRYESMIRESLHYINNDLPAPTPLPPIDRSLDTNTGKKTPVPPKESEKTEVKSDEAEQHVLETIQRLEGEEGAEWDAIIEACKGTYDSELVEESLNSLMDKGHIFEPVLGTIKTT